MRPPPDLGGRSADRRPPPRPPWASNAAVIEVGAGSGGAMTARTVRRPMTRPRSAGLKPGVSPRPESRVICGVAPSSRAHRRAHEGDLFYGVEATDSLLKGHHG